MLSRLIAMEDKNNNRHVHKSPGFKILTTFEHYQILKHFDTGLISEYFTSKTPSDLPPWCQVQTSARLPRQPEQISGVTLERERSGWQN